MILVEGTLIHHFLENSARRLPDKVALVHEGVRATYAQINELANQLAHYLLTSGVKSGDRVAMLLENSLEYVVAYYGILKAGAVAAPINTELKAETIGILLTELDAEILITQRKYERMLRQVNFETTAVKTVIIKDPKLSLSENLKVVGWKQIGADSAMQNPDIAILPEQLASIVYTSGSTGKPKGVMLSHKNIVTNVDSICQYLELTEDDIQMVVQPFFYVMGKSLLNTHFAVAGRVVINNKFAYPATVIQQMIDEQVTGFSGVPSTYAHLLHQSPLAASSDRLTSLRYCSQAGGHMAGSIKLKLLDILPEQTRLFVMYGATEASARLAYVEPEMLSKKLESIGKPIPGVSLRIISADGQQLPVGEIGEIVASGANITSGYWQDSEATSRVLDDYGYHTGDLGYQDEDGYFFVVGRKDHQLKVSGHKVNTQEIEDLLLAADHIMETAVIGIPDDLQENRLIALVMTSSDLSEKDLAVYCNKHLASYKVPQRFVFVDSIPKSASGKVDRQRCEELIKDC